MSTTEPDMTPREFSLAVEELRKGMDKRASISTVVMSSDLGASKEVMLYCGVYPTGNYSNGPEFSVHAESFRPLFEELQRKLESHASTYRVRVIQKMALAIIRITAERGECTDAALRNCGEFTPDQVTDLGADACATANDIAGRGPFTIKTIGGANAPAETEAA